jgi:hypothetical protein
MKKLLGSFVIAMSIFLVFAAPTTTKAADDVYYDLGSGSKLYIVAEVCKIANCVGVGATTDWYDYSTTSENVTGDAGSGQILVVQPGDTLSFLGATRVLGEASINPIYGIEFTNETYLTFNNIFDSIVEGIDYSDVDDDSNAFLYSSAEDIRLSGVLDSTSTAQIGAITATVSPDAPDGTLITGIFYVINPDLRVARLWGQRVLAASGDVYLRSEVQMRVSNPAPEQTATATATATEQTATPTPTAALPATGADSGSQLPYLLLAASAIIGSGTVCVLKRAKRKV